MSNWHSQNAQFYSHSQKNVAIRKKCPGQRWRLQRTFDLPANYCKFSKCQQPFPVWISLYYIYKYNTPDEKRYRNIIVVCRFRMFLLLLMHIKWHIKLYMHFILMYILSFIYTFLSALYIQGEGVFYHKLYSSGGLRKSAENTP